MSLAQDDLDRWLRLDVEDYFKGHEPRSIELARAPRLKNWCVNLVCERIETPSSILLKTAMSLTGHVTGHSERADGMLITTTRLVWLDRTENGREPSGASTGSASGPTPSKAGNEMPG
jgi:hypothetical protein